MKAFGSKRDGNASRMLFPIEFLSKTNGYRKSGQFPTVASGHQLALPLVPFDAPVESLAGLSTCSSDRRQVVSTPQQPVCGNEKVITYQRRSGGGSSGNVPKKKVLAKPPLNLPESSRAGASSRSRDTSQRRMDEESDDETEDDKRVHQLHPRSIVAPGHTLGEGSCDVNAGREDIGGDEALLKGDGGYDKDKGECGSGEDHMECKKVGVRCGSMVVRKWKTRNWKMKEEMPVFPRGLLPREEENAQRHRRRRELRL
ncbi:hypothetical protein CBR_g31799 [Chara braunii]|uniref:Uncharacterized protein n=1 Tax=Chara braunii TaxID=69332 RepID=A0A388LFX8_CHABU|nr:hypothetical protein CBR_g31799 [Chara braunii]|eukprot:GBG81123.1 hypothetical protein CBR_g31799 [Chara braunii]